MRFFGNAFHTKSVVGEPSLFSLEERIFNTVCVIAFVTMCFEVPFNFVIGLYVPAFLCLFGVFFSLYLYYLSRYKRRSLFGIRLFCLVCNLLFVVNYCYNSGIFGPNLLLFLLAFFLVVTIIPKREFKFWLPLNVFSVFVLLYIEYYHPEIARLAYTSNLSKFIDFGFTYFIASLMVYYSIAYIRENYESERKAVLDQNIAIEKQKVELERLHSEKDKLFSIVTHDLRSPLNSIQSYLELLTLAELGQEERMVLKKQLLDVTRATSTMLTNVVSWTKTQLEGAYATLTPVNVSDALKTGLAIEKNLAEKKGVKLSISISDDLVVFADRNMFELVVRNLVNNAIKFTTQGGEVQLNAYKDGVDCIVAVKDTGLGINPDQATNLFKLTAASTYGTENERGVGVGLLLCKEFTDLQGGKIWFESELGKGSTFFLSFSLN